MRLLLNIILVTITVLACYIDDIYLYYWPPLPDQAINLTIRSRRTFSFDQQTALDVNRKKALSDYTPVYRYTPPQVEGSKQKFEEFAEAITFFKEKKKKGVENLRKQLEKELGVQLSVDNIIRIIQYRDLKNLFDGIVTIEESILQNNILRDPQGLMGKEGLIGKKSIEIRTPNSNGTVTHPVDDLITLEKARFLLEEKIRQVFWQVDKRVLDPVVRVSLATLQPNLKYDHKENERRLDKINREFPSRVISYNQGDVLVPFRKILSEKDVLLLDAYQKHKIAEIYRDVPWTFFTILFMVVFYNLFLTKILANGSRTKPPYRFLLTVLITTVLILNGYLALLPFPIYGLPICLLPMLVIFLNHGKTLAAATAMIGAMLASFFTGPTYEILLFFTFGGLVAVLVSSGLQKRLQILVPSLMVGFINVLSIIVFTMDWQAISAQLVSPQTIKIEKLVPIVDAALTSDIAWAAVGGLAAGPLALMLLPLLEIGWDTASTFKLNRYMDLNRPLMKEMLAKAPGTYQHCMAVAYLAQSAGEAIGANTRLLRIGAYYHDVGKMINPKFFIENQFDGENPHDVLEPRESAKIILNHVRRGIKIGHEAGLPKIVVDLILEHHGTQLIEYFYNMAAKTYPNSTIREEEFRYPGPKPQSVEAAVLMVCDSVEAASRSLLDPSRKEFRKLVRHILVKRIVDGQFAECSLSTRDLSKFVTSLVDALEASFHSRIRYPWQEKKKLPLPRTNWTVRKGIEDDRKESTFRL